MRIQLLFLCLAMGASSVVRSQIIFSPDPFGMNDAIVVTYGSAGDFSLFDPMGAQTLYLYTGLETDGTADTWDYHDKWSDLDTLIPLNYNVSTNSYEGAFSIGPRSYVNSVTQETVMLPDGICANQWYFIIRNAAGNQTTNLIGSDYGFDTNSCYLTTRRVAFDHDGLRFIDGSIVNPTGESFQATLYNVWGQKMDTFYIGQNTSQPVNLPQKGVYIAVLINETRKVSLKFLF
ncbi:T9SS type A sorting domain-containing protein [Flavobacterium caeni]|uniref:Por secretion system C-terminal sorting domain-containing protein n=1 Tax=Flavobacterium caeni TaxID=490189 RepID=A0A1G5J1N0_9FLAO|nr:T9SS type A sorting domain-containing protein [Flavobacterium caeni]SCY82177.1 Por secretion system C-terminal sorting domain-containing protein [Flavobacterium caeni]